MSIQFIWGVLRKNLGTAKWSAIGLALIAGAEHAWWAAIPAVAIGAAASVWNRAEMARQSSENVDHAHLEFIQSMALALDARDPYTAGHSYRVGVYAFAIARAMGLGQSSAEMIRVGALLHDIGKIGIPDAVLQKTGPLTSEEFGLIKLHPQIGMKILDKLERFHDLLPIIELHHENYDGSGYPYKLAGENIPLTARIVRVADAFDAMVTHRHYRNALTVEGAIGELVTHAGSRFDATIVDVLVGLIESGEVTVGEPGSQLLGVAEVGDRTRCNFQPGDKRLKSSRHARVRHTRSVDAVR